MKKTLFIIIGSFLLAACSSNSTEQARLMHDLKPPLRFNPHQNTTNTTNTNKTDEQIRLLKAQTEAKIRLAEIENKKQERLKELEAQKATTIVKLESEREKTVRQLELQQAENTNAAKSKIAAVKAQTDIAIEKERQKHMLVKQKEDLSFYRQLTIAVIVLAILLMLLLYMLYRHRQSLKLKLHEEELRHQAYLQESRHHHERVTKMLEIIAHESTDKNLKKELTKLLKEQGEKPTLLQIGSR